MFDASYDLPTAYMISGMVFLIMPIITWGALMREKSRAVGWWCTGSLVMSLGLFVFGLRNANPGLLPFHTGLLLVMVGNMLHVHALQLERAKPSFAWQWVAVALVVMAFKELIYRYGAMGERHYLATHLMLAVNFGGIGWLAQQVASTENNASARWLSAINFLCAVVFGARCLFGLLDFWHPNLMQAGMVNILTTFVVVFTGIINNISVIGIYLERAQKRSAQSLVREARAQATAELTSQMAIADRQRSLGELAAGLAHELGQPITGILLNAKTLVHEIDNRRLTSHDLGDIAQDIATEADRASQILRGIRNFISPGNTTLTAVNLAETLTAVQTMLEPVFRHQDVHIRLHCSDPSPTVHGDATQLSQVFLNLLRNSFQARRPGQPLVVDVFIRQDGDFQEVVLQDNGIGMDDAQLALYGSAFFTRRIQI